MCSQENKSKGREEERLEQRGVEVRQGNRKRKKAVVGKRTGRKVVYGNKWMGRREGREEVGKREMLQRTYGV